MLAMGPATGEGPRVVVYRPSTDEQTFLCALKDWFSPSPSGGAIRSLNLRYNFDKALEIGARGLRHDGQVWTPLEIARQLGWLSVTKWLVEKGANVNAKSAPGHHALLHTVRNSCVAELLLDGGAFVDVRDSLGCTPLHHAARRGSMPLARLYISRGASLNALTDEFMDPEATANSHGNTDGKQWAIRAILGPLRIR